MTYDFVHQKKKKATKADFYSIFCLLEKINSSITSNKIAFKSYSLVHIGMPSRTYVCENSRHLLYRPCSCMCGYLKQPISNISTCHALDFET